MDGRTIVKRSVLLAVVFAALVLGSVSVVKADGLAAALPRLAGTAVLGQLTDGLPPPPPLPGGDGSQGNTGTGNPNTGTGNPSAAPEPASLMTALVGAGLVSFAAWRRRQRPA